MIDYVAGEQFVAADEFEVDRESSWQETPAIARLESGGFVVTYIVDRAVMVQRYDANGQKDGPPTALTEGGGHTFNSDPSVAGLAAGGYAVSWVNETTDVVVQLFDADGTAASRIFPVGGGSNYQHQPEITALAGGGFVVAWTFSGSATSIKARVFDASGDAVSDQIAVWSPKYSGAYFPQVASLADGGFVIAWSGGSDQGSNTVRAQAYNASGAPRGRLVRIENDPSHHDNNWESLAGLTSGHYVMTWTSSYGSGRGQIMGRLFDSRGAAVGEAFEVNSSTPHGAGQSSVTALDSGGFLVTWRSDSSEPGSDYSEHGEVRAQLFDANGAKIGEEFRVNQITHRGQHIPDVTEFGTGDVAILWRSYTRSGEEVHIRTFYSVTTGTAAADTLNGAAGTDILRGLAGSDSLDGGIGADMLEGGRGNDALYVDNPGDKVVERIGEGDDRVFASIDYRLGANVEHLTLVGDAITGTGNDGDNFLVGNDADNRLRGGDGEDRLSGGAGNDRLNGQSGADVMRGGTGDDLFIVDDADDLALERSGEGTDAVIAQVSHTLSGGVEHLRLSGAGAIDGTGNGLGNHIVGNTNNNLLDGRAGADRLSGDGGRDSLHGGSGGDSLTGGAGIDGFYFENRLGADNIDRITDFTAADDTIFLNRTVFAAIAADGRLAASAFHAGTAAADASDRIVYDQASGRIFYDADGLGGAAAMLFARVEAGTVLTNADFYAVG